jgi:hypothetical protein
MSTAFSDFDIADMECADLAAFTAEVHSNKPTFNET